MRDELKHRIDFLVGEHGHTMGMAKRTAMADAAARGVLSSSGFRLTSQELARSNLDSALQNFFAAADHAASEGVDHSDIRSILEAGLEQLLELARVNFGSNQDGGTAGPYGMTAEMLTALANRSQSLLRQHQSGFLRRNDAPTYSMTVTGSPGAAIQQGGQGNVQSVTNGIDPKAAATALADLAQALSELRGDAAEDARADMAALEAQLSRKEPKPALVAELGRSLRSTLENAAGGALTAAAVPAAVALWKALGIA